MRSKPLTKLSAIKMGSAFKQTPPILKKKKKVPGSKANKGR